jgi:hypothetical protein
MLARAELPEVREIQILGWQYSSFMHGGGKDFAIVTSGEVFCRNGIDVVLAQRVDEFDRQV